MSYVWGECIKKSQPWSRTECLRLLQQLNSLAYPLLDLQPQVVEDVLRYLLMSQEVMGAAEINAFAQLVSNVVIRQHTILGPALHSDLLQYMAHHVSSVPDPTELLYTCAEIVEQTSPSTEMLSKLLLTTSPLVTVLTKPTSHTAAKRGSLRCIAVLCCNPEVPQPTVHDLIVVLNSILDDMKDQKQLHDGSKYLLSLLRTLHSLIQSLISVRSLGLMPALLNTLKSYMCTGLHNSPTAGTQSGQSSVHNALQRKSQRSCRPVHVNNDDSTYTASCSSDSEFSDTNEPAAENAKFTNSRIRHQVHVCLAAIFQSLDHQTAFSYCQSFLGALQHKSLSFCILKDPASKVRFVDRLCRAGHIYITAV